MSDFTADLQAIADQIERRDRVIEEKDRVIQQQTDALSGAILRIAELEETVKRLHANFGLPV